MSEELLKELLEETKKQNKIQEEIKREMELQNDLKMYVMLRDKTVHNRDFIEQDTNKATRGKLYARLNDEDRSILERYSESNGRPNDELELYNITVGGFSPLWETKKVQEVIGKLHVEIFNDVYTERELYEYFERVFKRSGFHPSELNCHWEDEWQLEKDFMDKEENDEYKQKFMEKYENRITKEYGERRKKYEEQSEKRKRTE